MRQLFYSLYEGTVRLSVCRKKNGGKRNGKQDILDKFAVLEYLIIAKVFCINGFYSAPRKYRIGSSTSELEILRQPASTYPGTPSAVFLVFRAPLSCLHCNIFLECYKQNLKTFIHIIHNFIHIFPPSPLWITCAKLSLHNFNTSFRKNPLKYNTFRHFSPKQVDNNDSRKVFLPIIHIIHTDCFHTSHNTSSGISPEILPFHMPCPTIRRALYQKSAPWKFPQKYSLVEKSVLYWRCNDFCAAAVTPSARRINKYLWILTSRKTRYFSF